ncbi:MAG: glycoside hydrolase family 3 C-terminal domain-containing protein, partial [Alphaproteobacteria bacterium]|nr:glycoside hydrolase family 3 C-terminal domain-containing protein [Alphaproteobacteria bacterium]
TSGGVERLGISELCMMDGPHGVRSEPMRDEWTCLNREEDKCTYLPTESALAATFNTKLARIFGETLGSEARYRGKDIILGPGINIMRTPLCGRDFEYRSEDPTVICKLSPELVKGIESQDVASCVKHFVLNNQELDRGHVNVEVDERALNEIYLKGFYSAIIEGGASSVMGAYNRYKNQHLCHNKYLVKDLLKDKWGFSGVYLSDWDGCHDTEEAIFNGLDIEMGTKKLYNEYYLADAFLEKAKKDKEVAEVLDDKVRRILRLMFSVGRFSPDRKKGEFNTIEHQNNTYKIASEAMVLLKNNDNLLPIIPKKDLNILVVGENAVNKHSTGGSSSGIRTVYEITPLEGIKNKFGDLCKIEYESGNIDLTPKPIPTQCLDIIETHAGVRAFKLTTFTKDGDETNQTVTYSADGKIEDTTADSYKLELKVNIPSTGKYLFHIKTNNSVEMRIDGKTVLNQFMKPRIARSHEDIDFEYATDFVKGQNIQIEINN